MITFTPNPDQQNGHVATITWTDAAGTTNTLHVEATPHAAYSALTDAQRTGQQAVTFRPLQSVDGRSTYVSAYPGERVAINPGTVTNVS